LSRTTKPERSGTTAPLRAARTGVFIVSGRRQFRHE
jgi:hypothetical protein